MRTTCAILRRDLNPMIDTKLWQNPCWLSFRTNFIAHHFNQPLYDWIQRRYRLTPPEHVVLYALGLKEGITADDIAASSVAPEEHAEPRRQQPAAQEAGCCASRTSPTAGGFRSI